MSKLYIHYSIAYEQIYIHYSIAYEQIYMLFVVNAIESWLISASLAFAS